MTNATAKVVPLPCDTAARRERQLRAAWSEIDRLEQQLRAAQAKARKLEREVGKDCGYFTPISRESLALALARKDQP